MQRDKPQKYCSRGYRGVTDEGWTVAGWRRWLDSVDLPNMINVYTNVGWLESDRIEAERNRLVSRSIGWCTKSQAKDLVIFRAGTSTIEKRERVGLLKCGPSNGFIRLVVRLFEFDSTSHSLKPHNRQLATQPANVNWRADTTCARADPFRIGF